MTDALRAALWSLHQSDHDQENDETWCSSCGVSWPCPTAELLRAASRESAGADEWTQLANDIRLVDGNHDLGAGALAEALTARGWTRDSAGAGLDVERAAIIAAARLEDEVSRLRAELANCTAAYESVAPLNAELLAEAFTKVQPGVYGQDWPRDDPDEFQFLSPREHATAIAAEYARLAAAHHPVAEKTDHAE